MIMIIELSVFLQKIFVRMMGIPSFGVMFFFFLIHIRFLKVVL